MKLKALIFVAAVMVAAVAVGAPPKWRIKGVDKSKAESAAGRLILMELRIESKGPAFSGIIDAAFEITDRAGKKYLACARCLDDAGGQKEFYPYTVPIYLATGGLEAPTVTAYAVRLNIQSVGIVDEKLNRCASMTDLVVRNAGAAKIQVRQKPN